MLPGYFHHAYFTQFSFNSSHKVHCNNNLIKKKLFMVKIFMKSNVMPCVILLSGYLVLDRFMCHLIWILLPRQWFKCSFRYLKDSIAITDNRLLINYILLWKKIYNTCAISLRRDAGAVYPDRFCVIGTFSTSSSSTSSLAAIEVT